MIVWIFAVNSFDEDIQYRKGIGTDTTHWRVGTQGMTHSTRWDAVWAIRRPAHDGQNPRRLQLKASSISFLQVSHPSKAMGENAALQIVVKLALHIGRQAFGIGISVERGEKGFEMVRDHFIEHRWSSPSRCSGGEGLLLTVRVGPLLRLLSGSLVGLRDAQSLPDAFGRQW